MKENGARKRTKRWVWGIFLVAVSLTSCIDKDAGDIDPSLVYDAEFSLPLGDSLLQAWQFVDTTSLVPLPDTVDKDTIAWFLYDGVFYFSPGELYYRSETALSLSDFITDTSEITSLTFRINAVNRVPARMALQLYFADGNRVVLDSLFPDGPLLLEAAGTGAGGEVTLPYELWKKDVPFTASMIEELQRMEYAIEEYRLILPDAAVDSIPFYPDQEVWLQMGVRVGLKITVQ
jgi:hypothetical protein